MVKENWLLLLTFSKMTQNSNRILSILEHVDKIPEGGFEPPPLKRQEPKPCASTNSATLAFYFLIKK